MTAAPSTPPQPLAATADVSAVPGLAEDVGLPADGVYATHADLASAMDTLVYPMLALYCDGKLLHANVAASTMLAEGQPFALGPDQHVSPRSAPQRSVFAAALQAAAAGQPQRLHWADGGQTLHAVLRPLEPTSAGGPVLLMLAPSPDTPFDASGFATTHGLSAAETRVLEALLHGYKAEEAAEKLGVGVATVRSQIAAIRKKTGHRSVASLLAALGELPPLRRAAPR